MVVLLTNIRLSLAYCFGKDEIIYLNLFCDSIMLPCYARKTPNTKGCGKTKFFSKKICFVSFFLTIV